jgi:spermidine synthase
LGGGGGGGGGIAALAKRGDFVRFFEIDSQVEEFAREYFSYLEDSEAEVVVQLGDARLSLAREEAGGEEASYDVLLMDAFSGDAIPVHLATREACALYWERLEPDGILGFNITNQYVDLLPVMEGLAAEFGKQVVVVNNSEVPSWRIYESTWVLMTSNDAFLKVEAGVNFDRPVKREAPEGAVLWTDDYSSVWNVLRVFRREDGDEDEG